MPEIITKVPLGPVLDASMQGRILEARMPRGAVVVNVGQDPTLGGEPVMWVRANTDAAMVPRRYFTVATGQPIPDPPSPDHPDEHAVYVDTLQLAIHGGGLVNAQGEHEVGILETHLFECVARPDTGGA